MREPCARAGAQLSASEITRVAWRGVAGGWAGVVGRGAGGAGSVGDFLPEFPLPEEGAFVFWLSRPPQPIEPMYCRAAARQLRRLLTPSLPWAGEAGAAGVAGVGESGGIWRGWKMCVVRAVHALQKQPGNCCQMRAVCRCGNRGRVRQEVSMARKNEASTARSARWDSQALTAPGSTAPRKRRVSWVAAASTVVRACGAAAIASSRGRAAATVAST